MNCLSRISILISLPIILSSFSRCSGVRTSYTPSRNSCMAAFRRISFTLRRSPGELGKYELRILAIRDRASSAIFFSCPPVIFNSSVSRGSDKADGPGIKGSLCSQICLSRFNWSRVTSPSRFTPQSLQPATQAACQPFTRCRHSLMSSFWRSESSNSSSTIGNCKSCNRMPSVLGPCPIHRVTTALYLGPSICGDVRSTGFPVIFSNCSRCLGEKTFTISREPALPCA